VRVAIAALLALCLGACASIGREPITDLTPVFENAAAYDGRTFEGEVHVVRPFPRQGLRVALAPDAETFIMLDAWSAQRLENYYGLQPGHVIRIRALIREERIVLTQAEAGQCAPMQYAAAFLLEQVQVLRTPAR